MYKKQDLHDGVKSSLGRVQVTRDLSPLHFLGKAGGVRAKHNNGLFNFMTNTQGITKRRRLSLLTNSALVTRVQMRGEGGSCGVSANEYR
jgi:hypothetical protein